MRTPDGDTEKYLIEAGVLQGDTLAPFLFIIVLNEIMRSCISLAEEAVILEPFTLNVRSKNYFAPIRLSDLDFADDIVLINTSIASAERMLQALESEAMRAGFVINVKKTQCILLGNISGNVNTLSGNALKQVERYRYLGRWTDVDYDLTIRIATARTATQKMARVWMSKVLSRKHKAQLFKIFILPTLLYEVCTYPLTHTRVDRIREATTRMLKKSVHH